MPHPDSSHSGPASLSTQVGALYEHYAFPILFAANPTLWKEPRFKKGSQSATPDAFDPRTREWIDLKISSNGHSAQAAADKYSAFTDHLTIVALIDSGLAPPMVQHRSIFEYEETLGGEHTERFDKLRRLKELYLQGVRAAEGPLQEMLYEMNQERTTPAQGLRARTDALFGTEHASTFEATSRRRGRRARP